MKNVSDSTASTAEAVNDECVELVAKATIPTRYGVFESHVYRVKSTGAEHLTLIMGDVANGESDFAACIPNASPAMCLAPTAAIAANSSIWQCDI